jgi:hypothetical protein
MENTDSGNLKVPLQGLQQSTIVLRGKNRDQDQLRRFKLKSIPS